MAVTVQSQVQEVAMVAQALEKARTDLQRTLHDDQCAALPAFY